MIFHNNGTITEQGIYPWCPGIKTRCLWLLWCGPWAWFRRHNTFLPKTTIFTGAWTCERSTSALSFGWFLFALWSAVSLLHCSVAPTSANALRISLFDMSSPTHLMRFTSNPDNCSVILCPVRFSQFHRFLLGSNAGIDDRNSINTLRPRQNGRYFADDVFKCIFLNENLRYVCDLLWTLAMSTLVVGVLVLATV